MYHMLGEKSTDFVLTLSQTSLSFYVSAVCPLKTPWEKEKLLGTSNFSFSHSVFYPFWYFSATFIKFKLSSADCFSSGKFKICRLGMGLFSHNNALQCSILGNYFLKLAADNFNSNFTIMGKLWQNEIQKMWHDLGFEMIFYCLNLEKCYPPGWEHFHWRIFCKKDKQSLLWNPDYPFYTSLFN